MPKFTFARDLRTFYYTTVEADNFEDAERIAIENFDNFEDIEEGDAEWSDETILNDEEED